MEKVQTPLQKIIFICQVTFDYLRRAAPVTHYYESTRGCRNMFKFWIFIFFLVLYVQLDITVCQDVIVNITQGQLRGTPQVTHTGLPYYSFLGIPYAQPPVGPLRFKVCYYFMLCSCRL